MNASTTRSVLKQGWFISLMIGMACLAICLILFALDLAIMGDKFGDTNSWRWTGIMIFSQPAWIGLAVAAWLAARKIGREGFGSLGVGGRIFAAVFSGMALATGGYLVWEGRTDTHLGTAKDTFNVQSWGWRSIVVGLLAAGYCVYAARNPTKDQPEASNPSAPPQDKVAPSMPAATPVLSMAQIDKLAPVLQPYWKVVGKDQSTGQEVTREILAKSREEALAMGLLDGIDVSLVEETGKKAALVQPVAPVHVKPPPVPDTVVSAPAELSRVSPVPPMPTTVTTESSSARRRRILGGLIGIGGGLMMLFGGLMKLLGIKIGGDNVSIFSYIGFFVMIVGMIISFRRK